MTSSAVELAGTLFKNIETRNLMISVGIDERQVYVSYEYDRRRQQPDDSKKKLHGEVKGLAASVKPSANLGPCYGAYVIDSSRVNTRGGYGNLLYYIAMHFSGDKGITADRVLSSASAVESWDRLYKDGQVKKEPLDDIHDPKTPEKIDDCNLASSGIYGKTHADSKSQKAKDSIAAYGWNSRLSAGDERVKDEEDEETKSRKYRDEKASKLNYVYKGDSQDLIDYLESINIPLAINGKLPALKEEPPSPKSPSPKSSPSDPLETISSIERMFSIDESYKPKKISLARIIFRN